MQLWLDGRLYDSSSNSEIEQQITEMRNDLQDYGYDDQQIENRIESFKQYYNETSNYSANTDFELWDDNLQSLLIFIDCATQWRSAGMGGIIGLDYNAVDVVFKYQSIKPKKQYQLFKDIQACERVALDYFNKKSS